MLKKPCPVRSNYIQRREALSRHGQSLANIGILQLESIGSIAGTMNEEPVLTEKGREQARDLGKWLKEQRVDVVFVSPLLRAQETLALAKEVAGKSLHVLQLPTLGSSFGIFWIDCVASHCLKRLSSSQAACQTHQPLSRNCGKSNCMSPELGILTCWCWDWLAGHRIRMLNCYSSSPSICVIPEVGRTHSRRSESKDSRAIPTVEGQAPSRKMCRCAVTYADCTERFWASRQQV